MQNEETRFAEHFLNFAFCILQFAMCIKYSMLIIPAIDLGRPLRAAVSGRDG
jgi:hypothetical protein